jgi:hypothetical protein
VPADAPPPVSAEELERLARGLRFDNTDDSDRDAMVVERAAAELQAAQEREKRSRVEANTFKDVASFHQRKRAEAEERAEGYKRDFLAARERSEQAEEREKGLRDLLLECHGWMNGVEPKPAPPFLAAVLAAAQRTEETDDA